MSDNIIQLNEDLIKHDLKDLVRSSVEETLNALLDKEADELVNAQKYERSSERQGYRSGHYKRNFQTTSGEVELRVIVSIYFCKILTSFGGGTMIINIVYCNTTSNSGKQVSKCRNIKQ